MQEGISSISSHFSDDSRLLRTPSRLSTPTMPYHSGSSQTTMPLLELRHVDQLDLSATRARPPSTYACLFELIDIHGSVLFWIIRDQYISVDCPHIKAALFIAGSQAWKTKTQMLSYLGLSLRSANCYYSGRFHGRSSFAGRCEWIYVVKIMHIRFALRYKLTVLFLR